MSRPKKIRDVPQPPAVAEDEVLNSEREEFYYRQIMTGEIPPPPNPLDEEALVVSEPESPIVSTTTVFSTTLFLVEGKVRLQSILDSVYSQVVDQRRIVNATNVDEALQKFIKYYESMSNETQTYSVLQAAASETIL